MTQWQWTWQLHNDTTKKSIDLETKQVFMLSMASPIIFRCTFCFLPFVFVFALVEIMKVTPNHNLLQTLLKIGDLQFMIDRMLILGEHGDHLWHRKCIYSPPVNLHHWHQVKLLSIINVTILSKAAKNGCLVILLSNPSVSCRTWVTRWSPTAPMLLR